jgi:hypothetical protein
MADIPVVELIPQPSHREQAWAAPHILVHTGDQIAIAAVQGSHRAAADDNTIDTVGNWEGSHRDRTRRFTTPAKAAPWRR